MNFYNLLVLNCVLVLNGILISTSEADNSTEVNSPQVMAIDDDGAIVSPLDDIHQWRIEESPMKLDHSDFGAEIDGNGKVRGGRRKQKAHKHRVKMTRKMRKKQRRKNRRMQRRQKAMKKWPFVHDTEDIDNYDEKDDYADIDILKDNDYDYKDDTEIDQTSTPDVNDSSEGWLEGNITAIWFALRHIKKDVRQLRRHLKLSNMRHNEMDIETSTLGPCDPSWEVSPEACTDDQGLVCGGNGQCNCGQCVCKSPYYGIHCRCNDMVCQRHGGVFCGGAGRGQCRCGSCVCRPGYTGSACECDLSTSDCRKGEDEEICGGRGKCVCNRCHCGDGYAGKYCDESIYAASVCERLKPCVLCLAYGKKYPQCEDCNVNVEIVEKLESSRATCLMVNSGCILKYAYVTPVNVDEMTTVYVMKHKSCP